MSQQYLIIFKNSIPLSTKDELLDAIRSTYVSKQFEGYSAISISTDKDETPQDIHTKLQSLIKTNVSFIVIKMTTYFGNFPPGVFDWIKLTFPNKDYIG